MDDWDNALIAAHSARMSMGSWQEPIEPNLVGLTTNQWYQEMTRRMIEAACEIIRDDSQLLVKYGFWRE